MKAGHIMPDEFDRKLAVECAEAYSRSTGLGCTVSDVNGKIVHEAGQGCARCELCEAVGKCLGDCAQAHAYGMAEAERFGGKYIYFCPMGLTCFVSPIMGQVGSAAKITAGPFLMVELEDYIACDLRERLGLSDEGIGALLPLLQEIPYVTAARVNSLSVLLFMAVGFLNNVSDANRMLDEQEAEHIQGQISQYILELKNGGARPQYPIATERELTDAIHQSDRQNAQRLLNELIGYILFSSGGDFARIKTRIYELLVVISRAAGDAGAAPEYCFQLTHDFIQASGQIGNIDDLCVRLANIMPKFIDSIFACPDAKNADVVRKALQYIRGNYTRKITIDEVAQMVHLSPSYFSKVFKDEIGENFNIYLNRLRIEKSKKLLLHEDLRLVDIALSVGFEDQSYFSKVFKRATGVPPKAFRRSGGRTRRAEAE